MNETVQNFIATLERINARDYYLTHVQLQGNQVNVFDDEFTTYENNFTARLSENYAVLSAMDLMEEPRELIRQLQIQKRIVYEKEAGPYSFGLRQVLTELGDNDLIKELTLIPTLSFIKIRKIMHRETSVLLQKLKQKITFLIKSFSGIFLNSTCMQTN
jgi:hypothetical protein